MILRYNRSVDNAILQNILNMCLNASISIDLIAAGGAQTFFALNILESVITNLGGTIYYKSTLTGPYRDNTLAEIHAYMQVLVINNTYRSISARLRLSEGTIHPFFRTRLIGLPLLWRSHKQ